MPITKRKAPPALFDSLEYFNDTKLLLGQIVFEQDYKMSCAFLLAYRRSSSTFNVYRREAERLLQWSWHIHGKSIINLRRSDIEDYIAFCQKPPKAWIGLHNYPRFMMKNGQRVANPKWRPFVVQLSKSAYKKGEIAEREAYVLSSSALKDIFSVLSTYYNFLIAEEYAEVNPILQIRQKGQLIQKHQTTTLIRRLDASQWATVMQTAYQLADKIPVKHERTLFMLSLLYGLYLIHGYSKA